MAEESFAVTLSQEGLSFSQESLPLSQETYKFLCNEVQQSFQSLETPDLPLFHSSCLPNEQSTSSNAMEMCNQEQFVAHSNSQAINNPSQSLVPYVPSSMPASANWPGHYGFTISFPPRPRITKGVSWTYSKMKDKLYVGRDIACPVNFFTNGTLSSDVILRATALYSRPEHRSDVVQRCMDHSLEEMQRGLPEASHLVRCQSNSARYLVDPNTKRHSVVVPFENPPVGQHFSTYIYKFACFGSCKGGPDRRPLMVVFTLERGEEVIARHKLDVKICACPGRDQKIAEQELTFQGKPARTKKKYSEISVVEHSKSVHLSPKKSRLSQNKEGPFTVTVDDEESYQFLKQMKMFFFMCKTIKSLPPYVQKYAMQFIKGNNDDK
ncbi:cellular tumor antigen p53-like [Uloborus diversus]|uniref:cellular tumor antigen p53-like n=1 Tax=Uloborus diversus TaxID=327109 RepID=UPI002409141C|nr:cellular tumor antigen p53-like [Uloborus diversus]